MKKDTFLKGAFVYTVCIIISKILGVIYVIPFHAIIGEKGRTLYGYAYNIYSVFLTLSTIGLPLAISKIVSEYNEIDYQDAKKRSYRAALYISIITSVLCSLILFIIAPSIAKSIIGDIVGGNTPDEITYVIRISITAILFVTILSSMRGYLQGNKYISSSAISQVVEQLVRVIIIIFGSYFAMKYFGVMSAVSIAIIGATFGAIFALVYLYFKFNKEKKSTCNQYEIKEQEKKITNKYLIKKIIKYTIPFIIASLLTSLYSMVDIFTLVKVLVHYGKVNVNEAETILSILSTWGSKLNIIVISILSGISISLLPNVTGHLVSNNIIGIRRIVNKTLQVIVYISLPMVVGLSILAIPVWNVFYGYDTLGSNIFMYSIFTSLFYGLFFNINSIMQSVNRYKTIHISILCGIIFKLIMNVPLTILFIKMNIPSYYGSITATIIGYSISIIINLLDLRRTFKISYRKTFNNLCINIFYVTIMAILILIFQNIIPINVVSRINSVLVIIFYSIFGSIIYFILTYKTKLVDNIFGKNFLYRIPYLNKIIKRKKG